MEVKLLGKVIQAKGKEAWPGQRMGVYLKNYENVKDLEQDWLSWISKVLDLEIVCWHRVQNYSLFSQPSGRLAISVWVYPRTKGTLVNS